jgi:hypothetical protein
MADKETSTFEKMGDSIETLFNNRSGEASPYTMTTPKKNTQGGDIPGVGTKVNKSGSEIKGANGPACYVAAKITYPNSGEAGKNTRAAKKVSGGSQFYSARAAAGNGS